MNPEIIRVHDIHASIKDVGIQYYANRLIQDMNGKYYYLDIASFPDENRPELYEEDWSTAVVIRKNTIGPYKTDQDGENIYNIQKVFEEIYAYRPVEIPYQLAHFIIDCLKLKAMVMETGNGEYDGPYGGKCSVYLPPGVSALGTKTERLTEIPAELRPVVIERL